MNKNTGYTKIGEGKVDGMRQREVEAQQGKETCRENYRYFNVWCETKNGEWQG